MSQRFPATWAPYMTWAKHHPVSRFELSGSNLLPCTLADLPGAHEVLELYARNDDGYPPLVDAVARRYGVARDRVALATGASGANLLALAATIRPGDDVLVEWPGYDPHGGAARLLGAHVRHFERRWEDGFRLDPEPVAEAIRPETRAVVIANPHNPTGVYADAEAITAVGDIAARVGAKVIVDEVYLDAMFELDSTPAAKRGSVFVSTNSLTKSFGLSGLRVGWTLSDPDTTERILRVRDVVDAVGSIPSERLGVLAFEQLDQLLERARRILEPNGILLRDFVASRPELDWIAPDGGALGFPRLLETCDAEPFVEFARRDHEVGVTPGRFFGRPEHMRISIAGERSVLEGGLEALGRALDAYGG
jgi:aspartate/methionine/tyrosine aminotransferase